MLWLRQNQIQKKSVHVWYLSAVIVGCAVLPTLIHLLAECVGTGSGSSCAG